MARKTEAERWLGRGTTSKLPGGLRGKKADMSWKEFQAQIMRLPYMLDVAALNFTVDIAKRALVVFQHSFKEKRFYSGDGKTWPALSDFTIKKRMRKGTWPGHGGMLQEYGTLYDSLRREGNFNPAYNRVVAHRFRDKVWTYPGRFKSSKDHPGFVYAGIHNNPDGATYGNGFGGRIPPRPAKQRQFMGFSTYIDNFEEKFIDRYLFHQVFNRGGGGLMQGNEWNKALNFEE